MGTIDQPAKPRGLAVWKALGLPSVHRLPQGFVLDWHGRVLMVPDAESLARRL